MTLLKAVLAIARDAGQEILTHYDKAQLEVRAKADFSPVTAADLAADEILKRGLQKALPGSEYVSEEAIDTVLSPAMALDLVHTAKACWLVDPLDGTREFLSRTDDFTVNIALVESGALVMGVMYAPAHGLMYCAEKGMGSFKVHDDGRLEKMSGRSLNKKQIVALVSRQHTQGEEPFLKGKFAEITVQQAGSALKYGYLAQGSADFSFRRSPTSIWDTAAAQCILEEAGGAIWRADGQSLAFARDSLKNPPFLAASDAKMPPELRQDLLSSLMTVKK